MNVNGVYHMENKDLIKTIFTHPYINKKSWIFKADINWSKTEVEIDEDGDNYIKWKNGVWENGNWFDGTWKDGIWKNGTWNKGLWYNGYWYKGNWYGGKWYNGVWKSGKIYNPKTKQYELSKLPPNKCKWSLSYGK